VLVQPPSTSKYIQDPGCPRPLRRPEDSCTAWRWVAPGDVACVSLKCDASATGKAHCGAIVHVGSGISWVKSGKMRLSPHFLLRINFTTVRILLAHADAIDGKKVIARETRFGHLPQVMMRWALLRGFATPQEVPRQHLSPHCCFCWWPAAGGAARRGERAT
jgi:hypothetical protein